MAAPLMTRAAPSLARPRLLAIVVAGVVLVSFINYYGMAMSTVSTTSNGSAAVGTLEAQAKGDATLRGTQQELAAAASVNGSLLESDDIVVPKPTPVETTAAPTPKPTPAPTLPPPYQADSDQSQIHIVFSMSCTQGRRKILQTILQYSAASVGQKGPITQILSGCTDEQKAEVLKEPTFYYDFRRHFTPSYSPHPEEGVTDDYTPYNKPFALQHFLKHANPPVTHPILALIDGDFVFFKPMEVNTGRDVTKYYKGGRNASEVTDTVKDGSAIAQDWSNYMGPGWFHPGSRDKLDALCTGLPCINVTEADGKEFYGGTGPPYIMTTNDMRAMIDDYAHFVVVGRNVSKHWMTEMFGYAVAAGNHGIKHTILTNLGVTHPKMDTNKREYWEFVDETLSNPCADPFSVVIPQDPPVGLHYCQKYGYVLEENKGNFWYKYDLPETLASCESPLLKVPPANEWEITILVLDADAQRKKRHEVWAECSLAKITNQALIQYKHRMCPTGFNTFQSIELKSTR